MKTILLTITLFGMLMPARAQDSLRIETPEELGKQVLKAFQTNDFELFESLLITFEKHERILTQMEASDSAKAAYKREDSLQIVALQCNARNNFDSLRNRAIKNHIDWANMETVEIMTHPRNKKGIERADIVIIAKSGEVFFAIGLDLCMKSDTWFITQEVELKI